MTFWESLFWVTWLVLLIEFARWVDWKNDRWWVKYPPPLMFLALACWASASGI